MAKETVYIVQSYVAGRGKALKAEQQVGCKTAEEARRKAESLDWDRVFDDFLGELTGALSADASRWSAKQCASPVVHA